MKILHVFWINETRFSKLVAEATQKDFENRHYFLCLYDEMYDFLCHYENAIPVRNFKISKSASIINELASNYDYLFFHGLCTPREFLKIKQKYVKKIVWRTWGGDVGYEIKGKTFKDCVKKIINILFYKKASCVCLIGYANAVDIINMRNKVNSSTVKMSMPYLRDSDDSLSIMEKEKERQIEHEGINILLGHSGYCDDNHMALLDALKHLVDENIRIYIPLAYGDPRHINDIKNYISCNDFNNKCIVIEEFLPYSDYMHFLHEIDVAIFDGSVSYALGNITPLLFFNKKFFLNEKGVLAQTFREKNIPFLPTSSIQKMDYNSLISSVDYSNADLSDLGIYSCEQEKEMIRRILNYLNEKLQFAKS